MPIGTIPATGKAIDVPSCDLFTIEGGKVSVFECYYLGTILLGQIGVLANLEAFVEEITAQPGKQARVVGSHVDHASQCCTM